MRKLLFLFLNVWLSQYALFAQDDLMSILEEEAPDKENTVVTATFKGTRLINGHTVETRDKGVLVFIISHRFGRVNNGVEDLFGLDFANIRLGLDYSITGDFTVGVGRSSFNKVYDGFLKYQLLTQSQKMPVTITGFASVARRTDQINFEQGVFRNAYTGQLLIARKIGQNLSLQLAPTVVHRNFVFNEDEVNTLVTVGLGGRYKLTNQLTLNLEYFPLLNQGTVTNTEGQQLIYDTFSVGVDIETGGHVFQLHFTNAQQMQERGFIGETTGNFWDGDIHFGFNITRAFQLVKPKM
jgi:hypothetical protein